MKAVIVGAGVAGLGIGWRLAQAGVQVTVLERGEPGMGASFAAAGMIAATAEMAGAPRRRSPSAARATGICGRPSPPSSKLPAAGGWFIAATGR